MAQLQKLFEPIKIGNVEVKNRLYMAVFGGGAGLGEKNGMVSDPLIDYYAARARGGCGVITVGVSPQAPTVITARQGLGIYDDKFIPGLRRLTDAIHAAGAKMCLQLSCSNRLLKNGEPEIVGPSDIYPNPRHPEDKPRPLTVEEIHQIVETMGEGTKRARKTGCDLVEYYALAGNLISQFSSPYTNKRKDEYGGTYRRRLRFLLEIIQSAQEKAGKDFPLIPRISGQDFMPGGYLLEDTKVIAPMLEAAGVAALNISTGWHESKFAFIHMSTPRGNWIYMPEAIKKVVNIPIIGGTRVNDPLLAEQILAEGRVDMVYMGRPLCADPELPNKAKEGRLDEIRMCLSCNYCFERFGEQIGVACAINAQAGREAELTIKPAEKPKKVFIIGGGPGGMEAARVAALRGHQVTLFEKGDKLGGNLLVASVAPGKSETNNLTRYLTVQMEKLGVDVKLNQEATAQSIIEGHPDAVVVAIGTKPIVLNIPGVEGSNVVTAIDVLSGRKEVGDSVVIIGGGMVGCEVAEFLFEKGKKVTITEMLRRIGNDITPHNRWVTMMRLREADIKMLVNAKAEEITDKGVRVSRDGSSELLEGDTVILAVGLASQKKLAQELEGKVDNLHIIGDCLEPQRIAQAIEGAFRVAREI